MSWWNPFTWGDDADSDSAEARAKRWDGLYDASANERLPYNPNDPNRAVSIGANEQNEGGQYVDSQGNLTGYVNPAPSWQVHAPGTSWEKYTNGSGDPYGKTGADIRNYMYGRTPGGADAAVDRAYGTGTAAMGYGGLQAGRGISNGDAALAREAQYGNWGQQNNELEDASNLASALTGVESEAPSAAQAQLQQGTNQALRSQVALARSGRGFGGGAAASGLAATNAAGIQANQANSAASLRAQEEAAMRTRQASNIVNAAGIKQGVGAQYGGQAQADLSAFYQNRAQNDAAALGWNNMGNDAYFKGVTSELGAQGQASGVRAQEMQGGLAFEDNYLREWAAKNGYELQQQQMNNQRDAANTSAAATTAVGLMALSDVRAKTHIAPADGAGADFARGLDFDGTIYRPNEPSRGVSYHEQRPATHYSEGALTQMQQQHLGSGETTQLSGEDEARFRDWAKRNNVNDVDHPDSHYDYRGFWQENPNANVRGGVDHFPDTYKQHGHPTFSVESKYSRGFDDGGTWDYSGGKETFVPSLRPELKSPDTDALDAASLDAVRNSPASFYDYKDPGAPGANDHRNYGPMAQDLAKTPAGASAVVQKPDGKLGVDTGRLALVNTGALAEQQRQLDAITAELEAFKRQPGAEYPEYRR